MNWGDLGKDWGGVDWPLCPAPAWGKRVPNWGKVVVGNCGLPNNCCGPAFPSCSCSLSVSPLKNCWGSVVGIWGLARTGDCGEGDWGLNVGRVGNLGVKADWGSATGRRVGKRGLNVCG